MPKLSLPRSRARVLVVGLAATGLAFTAGVAVAGPAVTSPAQLALHGGATRLGGDQTKKVRNAVEGGKARNVILLIGDGMGDSEITSARNYQFGAAGRFPGIDALPLTGQYTTFALTKDGKPDYVTDSAASGSGWATGTKTYNGAISVDINGKPQVDPARARQEARPARPATSPPPRSRTRRPPSRPRTSRPAPATARSPPPRPARPTPSRTAAPARSPSRSSRPAPTSPWVAGRPPSPRRPPPDGTRA